MNDLDPVALRHAFGSYMTGVTVVTALADDETPVGFTANSFTSVSLDPPLLLVCPGNHLSSIEVFRQCRQFAISILAEGQEDISNVFASSGGDRFDVVDWTKDLHGVPLITGAAASFSCNTYTQLDCGDHCVLVGQVVEFSAHDRPGLGYGQGGYFSLANERLANATPVAGRSVRVGVIVEHDETVYVLQRDERIDLPSIDLPADVGARSAISSHLKELGLTAHLGRVYSVFDNPRTSEKHIYFTARLDERGTGSDRHLLPVAQIYEAAWPSKAIAAMMTRYREEHANRQFGLYIGDSEVGEVLHDNQA